MDQFFAKFTQPSSNLLNFAAEEGRSEPAALTWRRGQKMHCRKWPSSRIQVLTHLQTDRHETERGWSGQKRELVWVALYV